VRSDTARTVRRTSLLPLTTRRGRR
jgi:hypothetical protein